MRPHIFMVGNGIKNSMCVTLEREIEALDNNVYDTNNKLLDFKSGKGSNNVLGKMQVLNMKRRITNLEEEKDK